MCSMNQSSNNFRFHPYGSCGYTRELPIEWDILVAASTRCLRGPAGFLETEVVGTTPASCLWRLWQTELGDLGAFEVSKLANGRSQISFSGLGFQGLLSDKKYKIKQEHIKRVIDNYYFRLSQENIFPLDEKKDSVETGLEITEEKPKSPLAYIAIPEGEISESDRKILKMFEEGYSYKDIDEATFTNKGTVGNILSALRKLAKKKQANGEWENVVIPYHRDRRHLKKLGSD
jgi:hypothetical protein